MLKIILKQRLDLRPIKNDTACRWRHIITSVKFPPTANMEPVDGAALQLKDNYIIYI